MILHVYQHFYIQFWNVLQHHFFPYEVVVVPRKDHLNISVAYITYRIKEKFLTSLVLVHPPQKENQKSDR